MSHGGGDGDVAEPNLTPLLDLVLQLVMFFMIVANFVSEQLNQSIQLPEASTAVPIDKERTNIVILNVDENGFLLERTAGSDEDTKIDSPAKISLYLSDLYKFYKDQRTDKGVKEMTIVIRGHRNSTFDHVYRVMKAAKEAGFVNVQLRANKPKENT